MTVTRLTVTGRIPSKKNSRNVFCRKGRPVTIPSKEYLSWHKKSCLELIGTKRIDGMCEIKIVFFWPDRRITDLTNKAESIMDLLVDNHIITNDSWGYIPNLHLLSGGLDRGNPRAEISITQI